MSKHEHKDHREHREENAGDNKPPVSSAADAATGPAPDAASRPEGDKVSAIREELEAQKKLAAEYLDHLQRMKAEFENYKRRTVKEKADTIRYATERLVVNLLPVLDNLQRGMVYARENEDILKGMQMVERSLLDLLAEYGVSPFECLNQPFDPASHEPLYTVEKGDVPENTVVEEVQKGYRMHDKVIRVAKVVVTRAPAALTEGDAGPDCCDEC